LATISPCSVTAVAAELAVALDGLGQCLAFGGDGAEVGEADQRDGTADPADPRTVRNPSMAWASGLDVVGAGAWLGRGRVAAASRNDSTSRRRAVEAAPSAGPATMEVCMDTASRELADASRSCWTSSGEVGDQGRAEQRGERAVGDDEQGQGG
jgi:hypothetical protein